MPKVIQVGPKIRAKGASKQKSRIAYPYYDLDDSIEVAKAVHEKGGGHVTKDQLAHLLGYSTVKSGAFLTRISAAKLFGLIDIQKDDIFGTGRGMSILSPVMPDDAAIAKVEAFLSVPLFNSVYDKYIGQQLPQPVGLKNLFKNTFQIVPDRVTPALRVLMNSADQAGFFDFSGDRKKLIKPVEKSPSPKISKQGITPKPEEESPKPPARYGGGDEPPSGIHTAIIGLLRELPKPGTSWPKSNKDRFMGAFKATIDFIYPDADDSEETL